MIKTERVEFNPDDSYIYVVASALAYCPADRIMNGACGRASKLAKESKLVPIHAYQNKEAIDSIGYTILHRDDKDEIIIAFSGTKSYPQLMSEVARSFYVDYTIHADFKGARVMDYFYSFYVNQFRKDLQDQLKNHLEVHPDDTVVFTGHSLGGAMTVHASIDTILAGWLDKSQLLVYTYGQPRVGNRVFIDTIIEGLKVPSVS